MIVTFKDNPKQSDINSFRELIESYNCKITDASSSQKHLYGIIGDVSLINKQMILDLDYVEDVISITRPHQLIKTNHLKDKTILIVGLGLIGGSYAMSLHNKSYKVYAIDINQSSIEYGIKEGFVDNDLDDISLIKESDLIICSLYPKDTIKWVNDNQIYFKDNVIITDTCGVKTEVVLKVNETLKKGEFIGSHPMAGREVSGVRYASDKLFDEANFIITPFKNSDRAVEVLEELGEILNFKNIEKLSVYQHDDLIGFLSQLTHAIAVSLMNCQDTQSMIRYTGDSFRDLTRIAKINENLWSELFLINKEVLTNKIDIFIDSLNDLKNKVKDNDEKSLKELFISSTIARQKFDK